MTFSDTLEVISDLRTSFKLRSIWSILGWNDIVARYRRSLLGPFWVAGSIIATSVSLGIVFGAVFHRPLQTTIPYILTGLIVWQFAAMFLLEGPEVFLSQAGTMQNNSLPTFFYVLRVMTRNWITLLHNLVVLVLTFMVLQYFHGIRWEVLPALILISIFAAFSSAVAGLISARFRDMRFMLPQVGQLMFFVTPIFWHTEDIPLHDPRTVIYLYNPLYYMVSVLRDPLLGAPVAPMIWGGAVVVTLASIVVYLVAFGAMRRRLPFWL
jgi:ABC-type polysaccharide/polyol phosphate export permease